MFNYNKIQESKYYHLTGLVFSLISKVALATYENISANWLSVRNQHILIFVHKIFLQYSNYFGMNVSQIFHGYANA